MSKKLKLQSEIEIKEIHNEFLSLKKCKPSLFDNWSNEELKIFSQLFYVLKFPQDSMLATKNSAIDFFGIILSGKISLQIDFKNYGYLSKGDMIGYMIILKLQGSKQHQFDYFVEQEGFIALIRHQEFQSLKKKEPQIAYKIYELACKKALETVQFQFLGNFINNEVYLKHKLIDSKELLNKIENCPTLQQFIQILDKRDIKYFLSNINFIQIQPGDIVSRSGTKCDQIIVILNGVVQSFIGLKEAQKFYSGTIIGLKEFLFELNWQFNLYGSSVCEYLSLDRATMKNILEISPQSSINILSRLIQFQCQDMYKDMLKQQTLKQKKDEKLTLFSQRLAVSQQQKSHMSTNQQALSQKLGDDKTLKTLKTSNQNDKKSSYSISISQKEKILEYNELDISKALGEEKERILTQYIQVDKKQMNLQQQQVSLASQIKPLHILDIYNDQKKSFTKQKQQNKLQQDLQKIQKEESLNVDVDSTVGQESQQNIDGQYKIIIDDFLKNDQQQIFVEQPYNSSYLREKAHQSNDHIVRKEMKNNKKAENLNKTQQLEERYEDLQQALKIAQDNFQKKQYNLEKIILEGSQCQKQLKKLSKLNKIYMTKVNKNSLHNEILKQSGFNQTEFNEDFPQQNNFSQVLNFQLNSNKTYQLVVKCAKKWTSLCKRKKQQQQQKFDRINSIQ